MLATNIYRLMSYNYIMGFAIFIKGFAKRTRIEVKLLLKCVTWIHNYSRDSKRCHVRFIAAGYHQPGSFI